MGTVPYMSPEQLQGSTVDRRTDIFALGAVLYKMLTARHAFEGSSQAEIIAAVLKVDPKPLRTVRPHTPESLAAVIKACLHKAPDQRWQHAADVAMALRTMVREPRPVTEGRSHRRETAKAIRSLVVLPFTNANTDSSQRSLR